MAIEVDLDEVLVTPTGQTCKQPGSSKDETLGSLICTVLSSPQEGDQNAPVADKIRRAKLAERTWTGGKQSFAPEELTVIRNLIGKACLPFVILQVYRATGGEEAA